MKQTAAASAAAVSLFSEVRNVELGVSITEFQFKFIAEGDTITPHSTLHTLNNNVCALEFHMQGK